MQEISIEQAMKIFGGDNPAMGPYVAPMTAETREAYMNAMKPLISAMGALSGFVEKQIYDGYTAKMKAWNQAGGFSWDGSQYFWPSGVHAPVTIPDSVAAEMGKAQAKTNGEAIINCIASKGPFDTVQTLLNQCFQRGLEVEDDWSIYIGEDDPYSGAPVWG